MIIENKDDRLQSVTSTLAHFRRRQLMGTFPRDQHGPAVRSRKCGPKGRWRGPADGPPEGLIVEDGTRGHLCERHAHRGSPCFGYQDILRLEEVFPARIQGLHSDFLLPLPLTFA